MPKVKIKLMNYLSIVEKSNSYSTKKNSYLFFCYSIIGADYIPLCWRFLYYSYYYFYSFPFAQKKKV